MAEERFLYTHLNVDLDAVASLWAVLRFAPKMTDAKLMFVSADWGGTEMGHRDMAVDIEAGGRGYKGEREGGQMHSAFKMVMAKFAPIEVNYALTHLITYIDRQDLGCNVFESLTGIQVKTDNIKAIALTGLSAIFNGLKATTPNDEKIAQKMFEILDGQLKLAQNRKEALIESRDIKISLTKGLNKVAICRTCDKTIHGILFSRGVDIIVFSEGNNIGLVRQKNVKIRMDIVSKLIKDYGEEDSWFSHESGHLYCHGGRKSPAETPSQITAEILLYEISKLY